VEHLARTNALDAGVMGDLSPVELVVERLREHGCNPRRSGTRWSARCPAHDDRVASLSVGEGADRCALVRCHAGCATEEAIKPLDLAMRDLFPSGERADRPTRNVVATHDYVDEEGRLLFQTVRFSPKDFRQRRPDGNGGWVWNLNGTRRVLYRLPELLDAVSRGADILVVEGERDADAAADAGVTATCNPLGAGKWRSEYAELLRGAGLVGVVADRDDCGRAHARTVAASLRGVVEQVVILEALDGKDVSDHLAAGRELDDLVVMTDDTGGTAQRDIRGHSGDRFRSRVHVGAAVCDLPAPAALVDGLLFTPGQSVLYAPPKTYKTFLALDFALSVATGEQFMGRVVQTCTVLYVVAEGVGGIGRRVDAWRSRHNDADIDRAAFLTCAVNLTDRSAVDELCMIAVEHRAGLLVIDTLARCTVGADENSARDMGLVVESLDKLRDAINGHVLIVHHAGKDTTKGMRGSNALLGAVDTVIELSGDNDAIRVHVEAQKDAEAASDWYCRLEPSRASAVVVLVSDFDIVTAAQATVLDALEQLPLSDRTASRWQEMALEMGVSRRAFFRAKKGLQVRGRVTGGDKRGALYSVVGESNNEPPS
jgi:hypothetical protein